MYVRVTKTVNARGVLVHPEEVEALITDREADWYVSAFTYGEDAKEYWESNKKSIAGFNGKASTNTLFFDIDAENKFDLAKENTIKLVKYLTAQGFEKSIEVYFSGNKGFHVLLRTSNEFTPQETSVICHNLAVKEAQVTSTVFDTSVYNVTRIFRIVNTKHQTSGLYKIPVSIEELVEHLNEDEIKTLAAKPRFEVFDTIPSDLTEIKDYYTKLVQNKDNVIPINQQSKQAVESLKIDDDALANLIAPPGERKCLYALEQGHFGSGERHNAILRLAAEYKRKGYSLAHAKSLIDEALVKRLEKHPEVKEANPIENDRDVLQIYSDNWKGGFFSCKTDLYLQTKCDHGDGPCHDKAENKLKGVMTIDQAFNEYLVYGDQALLDYPKFGIDWIDNKLRLRPQNYSLICGANASGKTSLLICAMENFNKQKIPHVFFSLDMALPSLMEKVGSKFTPYTSREIEEAVNGHTRNSEIIADIKAVLVDKFPYTYFDFTSSSSLNSIEEKIQLLKSTGVDVQVAIVDYAGRLIAPSSTSGTAFASQYMSSTANAMLANDVCKRTKTHIMLVAQISRENGDHTEPLRSSRVAKESGAWEENATAVITCWRPFGKGLDSNDKYFHAYIAKNRSGASGEHVFKWEGKTGSIKELTQREFDDYRKLCESRGMDLFADNGTDLTSMITVDELEKDPKWAKKHQHGLVFESERGVDEHTERQAVPRAKVGRKPFNGT